MTLLPFFYTSDKDLSLMQTAWRSILNPLLGLPLLSGITLPNITLTSGVSNIINHTLGRMQQGWIVTDVNASTNIYRSAPFNSVTLTLTTSSTCVVNLWVY